MKRRDDMRRWIGIFNVQDVFFCIWLIKVKMHRNGCTWVYRHWGFTGRAENVTYPNIFASHRPEAETRSEDDSVVASVCCQVAQDIGSAQRRRYACKDTTARKDTATSKDTITSNDTTTCEDTTTTREDTTQGVQGRAPGVSGRFQSRFEDVWRYHLVGGLEHLDYLSHHIGNNHHPNWLIFFRGVGIPPTSNGLTPPKNTYIGVYGEYPPSIITLSNDKYIWWFPMDMM